MINIMRNFDYTPKIISIIVVFNTNKNNYKYIMLKL